MEFTNSKIIINKKSYYTLYCNTYGLLHFFRTYNKGVFEKSIIKLMTLQRGHEFKLYDFVIEDYKNKNKNKNVNYMLIYGNDEIISISRFIYKNKNGYINAVHTNKKYRRMGMCYKNIKKLFSFINKKIKYIKLDVDINNIGAIKCYKKIGFNINKECKKYKSYEMIFTI